MIPGSIEPQRVPIIRPSSGVKPMVVSTHFPSRTAAMEAPLPRWQMIRRAIPPRIRWRGASRTGS